MAPTRLPSITIITRKSKSDRGRRLGAASVQWQRAVFCHERHEDAELATLLHRGKDVLGAHRRLTNLIRELLAKGAKSGDLRNDPTPDELATYCLHAVSAAGSLRTRASVRKLVAVTMQGLRRPH